MKSFEYFAPETLEEAISILAEHKGRTKVLAGGTDLLVGMRSREITPEYVVDIKKIPDLDSLDYDEENGLSIGALATIRSLETSQLIRERFPILAEGAELIGSVQIRNRATVGGNLCNAAPSADTAPPLICLDAQVKIAGPRGEKSLPLEEFFTGPGETVLDDGEILTEILVPNPLAYTGGAYTRHTTRRAMDIAVVGVGVTLTLGSDDGVCKDARIALGSVAPTPMRAKSAEEILKGKKIEDGLIERAAQSASDESRPISDVRGSAEFRKEIVKVLTRRMTRCALERTRSA